MENEEKIVDIDKVFRERNPRLFRLLPGFVKRYIKNTLHEDLINRVLIKGKEVYGIDFANLILREIDMHVKFRGIENIPVSGPVIIAANHPLGGIDGTALISMAGSVRKDVHILSNDLLTNLKNFGEVFIPVNKLGVNARRTLEKVDQIYASDAAVLLFPAGLCSRKQKGVVTDLPWQKGFVSKARKYQHPIVPVLVVGRNSNWFYNLSMVRKALGIKANIEMFYLADEMIKQKGKTVELIIGKPIQASLLTDDRTAAQWTDLIRAFLYNLEKEPQLDFANFLQSAGIRK